MMPDSSGVERPDVEFGDARLPERFWAKVKVAGGCWLWTAALSSGGYGLFWVAGRSSEVAHRHAYTVLIGDPGDLTIDHLCRNRPCVNPAHLEAVTNRENILRGEGATAQNARKTHCVHGHELTPENTYLASTGRQCRICRRKSSTRASRTRDECRRAELNVERLEAALSVLVQLKDGPRDDAYRNAKDQAWQEARDVLASLDTGEGA